MSQTAAHRALPAPIAPGVPDIQSLRSLKGMGYIVHADGAWFPVMPACIKRNGHELRSPNGLRTKKSSLSDKVVG